MKFKNIFFRFGIPLIISLIPILWTYFIHNEYRELSYEIISKIEFTSLKSEAWSDVHILYKNKAITNGGILTVKVKNTGNLPLYPKDFDGPITIKLPEESNFLFFKIVKTQPNNLLPKLFSMKNNLIVAPLLLNPNDEIIIESLIMGKMENIAVAARIGGVKEVADSKIRRATLYKSLAWVILIYVLLCFIGYSLIGYDVSSKLTEKIFFRQKAELNLGRRKTDLNIYTLSQGSAILIMILLVLSASFAIYNFLQIQGVVSFWYYLLCSFVLMLLGGIITIPIKAKEKKIK
jgi:hypothetical protein